MVYSPGNRDYPSAYQPAFPSQRANAESSLPRNLFIAVVVLGLAAYGFSFGPVLNDSGGLGWAVRFATVAALCAAFSLLAKQKPLTLATAVLATMSFLDALSTVLMANDRGWALTVIAVLTALQTLAAVGALLLEPKDSPERGDAASYEAYVEYYNQAIRSYYGQQGQPEQSQHAGYGQAYGDGRATQRVQRAQRPSQHGDYADLDYSGTRTTAPQHDPAGSAAGPTGLPSFGQAHTRADQQLRETDGSTQPSSPA